MELVLAVLMGLGIFLVIPVFIGFSIIGIYLLNKRRVLKAERTKILSHALGDMERDAANADINKPSETIANDKIKEYAEVK
ncbi:MAG: hypothetical protein JSU58_01235 [Dehalococcoidales bacterium]|nr:MAG: hypothetical protein JSU58_01235 [Dehalococcoidales bacterium]